MNAWVFARILYYGGMAACSRCKKLRALQSTTNNLVQALGYKSPKQKQLEVVARILNSRDVLAVLPTGYDKSLCFNCLPFLYVRFFPGVAS